MSDTIKRTNEQCTASSLFHYHASSKNAILSIAFIALVSFNSEFLLRFLPSTWYLWLSSFVWLPRFQLIDSWRYSKLLIVLVYTIAGALATGLGCIPLFFVRSVNKRMQSLCAAAASGIMAIASIELIREGLLCAVDFKHSLCFFGIACGIALVKLADHLVIVFDVTIDGLKGSQARRAIIILSVMTLHSFAEGVGIGVSFSAGEEIGPFIALAIGLHNIPEGMVIGLSLIDQHKPYMATMYSILSSAPQPLVSVPAFLFVQNFQLFLPVGLGLAAGAMCWLVVTELTPQSLEHISTLEFISIFCIASMGMYVANALLHFAERFLIRRL